MMHFAKAIAMPVAFILLFAWESGAQNAGTTYDPKKYRKEPVWIEMMNDPNANYFETLKAFREFWQGYKLPGEPAELENFDQFEVEVGLAPAKPKKRDNKEEEEREHERVRKGRNYAFEVKQFKGWLRDAQPWVQEDGRILPAEERQKILDKQQRELKEAESKH